MNDGMPEMNDPVPPKHVVTIDKRIIKDDFDQAGHLYDYPVWRGECKTCLWVGRWERVEKNARVVAQRHADRLPETTTGSTHWGMWLFLLALFFIAGALTERVFG